jgi:ubiquinone/menaquinone biosynthesis C-methylase UbiE
MTPNWQWNERQQIGTDYADLVEVSQYDQRMAAIRNFDAENAEILSLLNLSSGDKVLEIGCGTGRFALAAAKTGLEVSVIDISPLMLDYVREQAQKAGIEKITTQNSGFLTMDFPTATFDAVVSSLALHHLPDAWKGVGLFHVANLLKPKGQFVLRDVVFATQPGQNPSVGIERFAVAFETMRKETSRHTAFEFSTYDWIMEGLLRQSGFEMLRQMRSVEAIVLYHCRKIAK